MTTCYPNAPAPVADYDECAALPELKRAYHLLLSGNAPQQIRAGDRWYQTARGDPIRLAAEIRRLEIICQNSGPRAVRAGPYRSIATPRTSPFGVVGSYRWTRF